MATVVHDTTTLQNAASGSSFQTAVAEPPLRSKSCGPDVGRDSASSDTKKDDTVSSTMPPRGDAKPSSRPGVAVCESKSATAVTSSTTKIFDNKIFVEAPIPKTNPWLKSVNPLNKNQGENVDMEDSVIMLHA